MPRLPRISELNGTSSGAGFFLCARKERRTGRTGSFLVLVLQDTSGSIDAKVFQDADVMSAQFEAGEFVAVQAKGNLFNQRLELNRTYLEFVRVNRHHKLNAFRFEQLIHLIEGLENICGVSPECSG